MNSHFMQWYADMLHDFSDNIRFVLRQYQSARVEVTLWMIITRLLSWTTAAIPLDRNCLFLGPFPNNLSKVLFDSCLTSDVTVFQCVLRSTGKRDSLHNLRKTRDPTRYAFVCWFSPLELPVGHRSSVGLGNRTDLVVIGHLVCWRKRKVNVVLFGSSASGLHPIVTLERTQFVTNNEHMYVLWGEAGYLISHCCCSSSKPIRCDKRVSELRRFNTLTTSSMLHQRMYTSRHWSVQFSKAHLHSGVLLVSTKNDER